MKEQKADVITYVRLSRELDDYVKAELELLKCEFPKLTKSDVIRLIIERDSKKKKKK